MATHALVGLLACSVLPAGLALTERGRTAYWTELIAPVYSHEANNKVLTTAQISSNPAQWPEYTDPANSTQWVYRSASDWTSAFFADQLYLLHERFSTLCPNDDNTTDWLSLARTWSNGLYNPSQDVLASWAHDVGFNSAPMMHELRLNPANETAKNALLANAQYLASRYSSVVGCTKSWDRGEGDFEVIIDNMMNLQLLLTAADLSGNSTYRDMATSHANKTMQNHIRSDGSSYHVVNYDPTNGQVLWKGTSQGYLNESTWTRGHAWGTLGFALMYNATGISAYYDTAVRMAMFALNATTDGVPWGYGNPVTPLYWDFSAPRPTTLDTSASAIFDTALILLLSLEASRGNASGGNTWFYPATDLFAYSAEFCGTNTSQIQTAWTGASILGNATINNRANPPLNNTGAVYGDAYVLRAANYFLKLGMLNCTAGPTNIGTAAVGASPSALSAPWIKATNASASSSGNGTGASAGQSGGSMSGGATSGAGALRPSLLFGLLASVRDRLR
ncbi:hypothetical protein JCM10296v2_003727 [Rhodotorula toruloides]